MPDAIPAIPRQELLDAAGRPFAYIVSADEMHRLLAEVEMLRQRREELAEIIGRVMKVREMPVPSYDPAALVNGEEALNKIIARAKLLFSETVREPAAAPPTIIDVGRRAAV